MRVRDKASARGFTLVELLIVVAIIAILASIALVNFLEAQTRGKVTRAKAEMRSLATALEAYRTDAGAYPPPASNGHGARLFRLSTPISYITDPKAAEPFRDKGLFPVQPYGYHGRNELVNVSWNNDGSLGSFSGTAEVYWWLLRSSGPDNDRDGGAASALNSPSSRNAFVQFMYDPTNGSVSRGDIWRMGGEPTGQGSDSAGLITGQ